jgi:uncharacterized phiE125 gp8 family phage protein
MLTQVTAAAARALDWEAEVKGHLRLDDDTERSRVEAVLMPAADQLARQETGLSLIARTMRLTLDAFPLDGQQLEIPVPPLISITSVKYIDEDGVQQTWDPALYVVKGKVADGAPPDDGPPVPGRLYPAYDKVWPTTRSLQPDAVEIVFEAGYGVASTNIPAFLRAGMLLVVGELYEHREDTITGTIIAALPRAASDIFRKYRVPKFREGWTV